MSSKRRLARSIAANTRPMSGNRQPGSATLATAVRGQNVGPDDPRFMLAVVATEVERAERLTASEILDEGRTIEKAVEVADNAAGWARRVVADLKKKYPPPKPVACRQGCFFCCYLPVTTDIPFVIRIAEFMRAEFTPEALADARQRIEEHVVASLATPASRRFTTRLRCPLLVEGLCSVYPVRPLSCQGWHSLDVSRCEADYNHPDSQATAPINVLELAPSKWVGNGLADGLRRVGLDAHEVDFIPALRIALDEPDAAVRWLAGEDAFRAAWISEGDPEYQAALAEADAINRSANPGSPIFGP